MFVSDVYEPRISDYTPAGRLSYEAMLQSLENTGNHHMQAVHDSLVNGNIAWVLADWRVAISRRPVLGERLHVTTWVQGKARAGAISRFFLVKDDSGQELYRAASRFALVDRSTKRLVRITEELLTAYGPETEPAFASEAPRLRAPETFEAVQPIVLRRSDIDYNGHVHNTRYISFALEMLPEEDYTADALKAFRIVCSSSVEAGSSPEIRRTTVGDGWIFTILVDGKICTVMHLQQ